MKHLFAAAEKLQLKNKTVLRLEGSVCYVSSGYVALEADLDGSQFTLQLFKKGEVIDDFFLQTRNSLLPGLSLSLRAQSNLTLLCMPQDKFQAAVFSSLQSGAKYVAYLQQQNLRLSARLAAMSYKDVYRRLVARLLFLAEWFGSSSRDRATIGLPLTHRQLALSVSSTRETVNKLMRRLTDKKLISTENRCITVNSVQRLKSELS
jgi:CRP/FNR family transcriptional regulator